MEASGAESERGPAGDSAPALDAPGILQSPPKRRKLDEGVSVGVGEVSGSREAVVRKGRAPDVTLEAIEHIICANCGGGEDDDQLLLCDTCNSGYHMACLRPPLVAVPEGDWHCATCRAHPPTNGPAGPRPHPSAPGTTHRATILPTDGSSGSGRVGGRSAGLSPAAQAYAQSLALACGTARLPTLISMPLLKWTPLPGAEGRTLASGAEVVLNTPLSQLWLAVNWTDSFTVDMEEFGPRQLSHLTKRPGGSMFPLVSRELLVGHPQAPVDPSALPQPNPQALPSSHPN